MLRKLIDVSDTWLERFNAVLPSADDTLSGFQNQIAHCVTIGSVEPTDLLMQLNSQITDLRRSLESVRYIF